MPPKPKVKREAIVEIAFAHVRRHGWQGLTARFLAAELNTSTKPIYFHFNAMGEIEEMVVKRAMDIILRYTTTPRTDDVWTDQAMGVVLFALEEKQLFRAIFDEKHVESRRRYSRPVWKANERNLAGYPLFEGLSAAQVELIRRARWVFVHGLASLVNISNWPGRKDSEAILTEMVRRMSRAVYHEFKEDEGVLLGSVFTPQKTDDPAAP